jgi:hypothetical protein
VARELIDLCVVRGLPFRHHPLGFLICTMFSDPPEHGRIHIWPALNASSEDVVCPIHDHVFEFTSWVLAGELQNIEYHVSATGRPHAMYHAEYTGNRSVLVRTSSIVNLEESSRVVHPTGSVYSVASGQLHETRLVGPGPAVSVLLTTDKNSGPPIVLGPLDGVHRYDYYRREASLEEIKAACLGI